MFSGLNLPELISFRSSALPPCAKPARQHRQKNRKMNFLFIGLDDFIGCFYVSAKVTINGEPSKQEG